MAVLKRIKASTLMETLVATVLIVVVFMLASMVLNALFVGNTSRNHNQVQQELLQLQYRFEHDKLPIPYYEEMDSWDITVIKEITEKTSSKVVFTATHRESNRKITLMTLSE